mmetsp:Transcript_785/g.2856  ORF Transcript_785/g.2856 Transcript_785/m.2856 type:complete len:207 (+) Transcript_785:1098-1718(+)
MKSARMSSGWSTSSSSSSAEMAMQNVAWSTVKACVKLWNGFASRYDAATVSTNLLSVLYGISNVSSKAKRRKMSTVSSQRSSVESWVASRSQSSISIRDDDPAKLFVVLRIVSRIESLRGVVSTEGRASFPVADASSSSSTKFAKSSAYFCLSTMLRAFSTMLADEKRDVVRVMSGWCRPARSNAVGLTASAPPPPAFSSRAAAAP